MPPETTRHPHNYRWRERFPTAARVFAGEGGGVYAAEDADDKSLWLIKDEGTLADFLPEEDWGGLVSLTRYSSRHRARWVAEIVEMRQRAARHTPEGVPEGTGGAHDDLVAALVDDTAAYAEALAYWQGLGAVNERDHLQPCCAGATRALARTCSPRPAASTQLKVEFAAWPGLGAVDVALQWPEQLPVLLELKCGKGLDAAGECVWDAAKLAFTLQCDKASDAYLLAGAPVTDWERPIPIRGTEFFDAGSHDIALLRVLYGDWWRTWEKRKDPQPSELPRRFRTEPVHRARLEVAAVAWELRLAAVVAEDHERVPWPRLSAGPGEEPTP